LFRHFRNFCFVALVVGCAAAVVVGPAGAQTIDDKRAEAAALTDQIEQANIKLSEMGEQFNAVQIKLDEAEAELAAVKAQIAATKAEIARIKALVEERAASTYRRARAGETINDDLDVGGDAEDLVSRKQYASTQAERDDELLDDLKDARHKLGEYRETKQDARDEAAAERQRLEEMRAQLEAQTAKQEALLRQVKGELAQMIHDELERRQREAEAMAQANFNDDGSGSANLPPPGPSTKQAIAFAKQQMGKTYVYAASGPDHYDCSGLVMAAFRSAGVSLPHYSGAQYAMLPHVTLTAMMPGDLVFWGTGGSSHVAIYLGNYQIIESGGTGHDVHIGPIWGHPVGAARVLQ
jgi:peptidoglycan DL-endopeptidase CwlO